MAEAYSVWSPTGSNTQLKSLIFFHKSYYYYWTATLISHQWTHWSIWKRTSNQFSIELYRVKQLSHQIITPNTSTVTSSNHQQSKLQCVSVYVVHQNRQVPSLKSFPLNIWNCERIKCELEWVSVDYLHVNIFKNMWQAYIIIKHR